jgi:hypothetical protein
VKFEITSYVGAGCLTFGMTRGSIRKCFDNKFKEFKKTPNSETLTDAFGLCHVYYKKNDTCEAVEFFGDADVIFNDEQIIGRAYNEIKDWFDKIDELLDINDAGFTSLKYGIGVFAPFARKEPEEPVESVIIFEEGYFD